MRQKMQKGKGTYKKSSFKSPQQKKKGGAREILQSNMNRTQPVTELHAGYCHPKGHLFKLEPTNHPTCERYLKD
jgi:hypothetical protein